MRDELKLDDPSSQYIDIDLKDLFEFIWKGKPIIIIALVTTAIASYFYAKSLPDSYISTAIVLPSEDASSQLSALSGQYSSLASLAGINIPSGGSRRADMALKIMQSQDFVRALDQKFDLAPYLLAVTEWDAESNQLSFDSDLYDKATGEWKGQGGRSPLRRRDYDVYSALMSSLSIDTDGSSGFTSISIEHLSPQFAKELVEILIRGINDNLRTRDIRDSEKSIMFLRQQAKNNALADLDTVIYGLVEVQIRTMMLAQTKEDYVFEIIDPPAVPMHPAGPTRHVLVMIFVASSILLTIMLQVGFYFFRRKIRD